MMEMVIVFMVSFCVNMVNTFIELGESFDFTSFSNAYFSHLNIGLLYGAMFMLLLRKRMGFVLDSSLVARFGKRKKLMLIILFNGAECAFVLSVSINAAFFAIALIIGFPVNVLSVVIGNMIIQILLWFFVFEICVILLLIKNDIIPAVVITLGLFDIVLFGRLSMLFPFREYIWDIQGIMLSGLEGTHSVIRNTMLLVSLSAMLMFIPMKMLSMRDILYKEKQ